MRRRVPRCAPGLRQLKPRVAVSIQRRERPNGTVNQPIRKESDLRSTFPHAFLAAMYRQPRRLHPLGPGKDRRVFAHGMDVQVLVWWLPIPHTRLVILSLSFLFVFSRGRHGDVSEHPISRAQRSRQIAALGASRSLPRVPAKVPSLSRPVSSSGLMSTCCHPLALRLMTPHEALASLRGRCQAAS